MAIRPNLCTRPALKFVGGPGWSIPPTSWARSTAMHATMPRTTGVAGAASGVVISASAAVIPGQTYAGSISLRAVAAVSGNVSLQWLASDNSLMTTTTPVPYTQSASTTVRLTTGPGVAPAGAAMVGVRVTVPAGSCQVTGALIEQASATGAYFDGDDTGARWAGADGASASLTGTSELATTITYDERIGRVRVLGTGMAPGVGRVRVSRRPATSNTFAPVRGGEVPVSSGTFERSADDYEFPAGENLIYRLESLAGRVATEGLDSVLESVDVFYVPPMARAWVKFIAHPILNRRITITDWSEISRPSRNVLYEVRERADPVIVTAGHSSRRVTLTLRTWTVDETNALDESLRQGIPLFLHMPAGYPLPSLYAVPGDYSHVKPSRRSRGSIWTLPLTEVAPPAPSIYGTGTTWATVLDAYATWGDLLTSAPTWQGVQ
jgi:hypothetical protein